MWAQVSFGQAITADFFLRFEFVFCFAIAFSYLQLLPQEPSLQEPFLQQTLQAPGWPPGKHEEHRSGKSELF